MSDRTPHEEAATPTDGLREALYDSYLSWVEMMALAAIAGESPPTAEAAAYRFANYAVHGVRAALGRSAPQEEQPSPSDEAVRELTEEAQRLGMYGDSLKGDGQ